MDLFLKDFSKPYFLRSTCHKSQMIYNGVYAGKDGKVYKKDNGGGWSQYNNGSWNQVNKNQASAQNLSSSENARQRRQSQMQSHQNHQ